MRHYISCSVWYNMQGSVDRNPYQVTSFLLIDKMDSSRLIDRKYLLQIAQRCQLFLKPTNIEFILSQHVCKHLHNQFQFTWL